VDLRAALWSLSIFSGVAYFITIPWHPFPGTIALKGLSVSMMAVAAWISMEESPLQKERRLLTAALALSSLGDILLDMQGKFVFGLGSFLLAHICYVQLFFSQRKKGQKMGLARTLIAVALLPYSIGFSIYLMPGLGDMGFPVMMYIGVITAMVFSALVWRTPKDWVLIGAILFLISDSVLGASKFRDPVPFRGWIVWSTYYGAQYLIARGALRAFGIFPQAKP
jgi:uncharacterized membrane protein YhhN